MVPPHRATGRTNGVIEGVSSFGTDLATLAMLQAQLAACDLRDSTKPAIPSLGRPGRLRDDRRGLHRGRAGRPRALAGRGLPGPAGYRDDGVAMVGLVIAGIASFPRSGRWPRASRTSAARRKSWIATWPGSRPRSSTAGADNPGPPCRRHSDSRISPVGETRTSRILPLLACLPRIS